MSWTQLQTLGFPGLGGDKKGPGRRGKKDTKNRMKKVRGKDKTKAEWSCSLESICAINDATYATVLIALIRGSLFRLPSS